MEFSDFIQDYTQKVKVTKETGHWDQGDWIEDGPVDYYAGLAIMHLSAEDLRNYEAGKYTRQDIKVFAVEDLQAEIIETGEKVLLVLEEGDLIEYQGKTYKIDDDEDNTDLSDFYEYVATKVVIKK